MPSEVRYKPDPGKRKCQAVQEDVSKRGDSRTCPEEQVRVNFVKEEDSWDMLHSLNNLVPVGLKQALEFYLNKTHH